MKWPWSKAKPPAGPETMEEAIEQAAMALARYQGIGNWGYHSQQTRDEYRAKVRVVIEALGGEP